MSKHSQQFRRHHYFETLEPRSMLNGAKAIPIVGDWGSGIDSAGLVDPSNRNVYLRHDNETGFAHQIEKLAGGLKRAQVLAGDWDGDGIDTLATFDPRRGEFWLTNTPGSGRLHREFVYRSMPASTQAIVGDFDGNGRDTLAIYDPESGKFLIRNALDPARQEVEFEFGPDSPGWTHAVAGKLLALAGDWDGDGQDSVGLYDTKNGRLYTNNDFKTNGVEAVFILKDAASSTIPLAGDWNGDGKDTLGSYDTKSDGFTINAAAGASGRKEFYIAMVDQSESASSPRSAARAAASASSTDDKHRITIDDVKKLLRRAAAASASKDAIIAIVDRRGRILGVRAESEVLKTFTDTGKLVFAIDGAVSKALTAAYFSNDAAPLTSRTVRFISQSTVTQREVQANPNIKNLESRIRGPGFVAPIGLGGHFPPDIKNTPPVDLFAIEHTNRDGLTNSGKDGIKGTKDDVKLPNRFNVPDAYLKASIPVPESYGVQSGLLPGATGRGIATLPGGIPLFKNGKLVGAIGVFFPGSKGYATFEQSFKRGDDKTATQRTNTRRILEAEWIAAAAAGGTTASPIGSLNGVAPVKGFVVPAGSIYLGGIKLESVGPNVGGLNAVINVGRSVGLGDPNDGENQIVKPGGRHYLEGRNVADGWLVMPHDGEGISASQVKKIIQNGIDEANRVRAAIRLPIGSRTRMVLAVTDKTGAVLGLYRMKDATVFSIDVAVAKARNVAYYADPTELQNFDRVRVDDPNGPYLQKGIAFTNRTFRFLAEPRFPAGIDGTVPPAFSILRENWVNPKNAENKSKTPAKASDIRTVLGYDAFNVGTNFHDQNNKKNQNGVVFFPGSSPLYIDELLKGGFGVSGDGVDQDDVVTFAGQRGFGAPNAIQADEFFVRGVRLPYQKFSRNPYA